MQLPRCFVSEPLHLQKVQRWGLASQAHTIWPRILPLHPQPLSFFLINFVDRALMPWWWVWPCTPISFGKSSCWHDYKSSAFNYCTCLACSTSSKLLTFLCSQAPSLTSTQLYNIHDEQIGWPQYEVWHDICWNHSIFASKALLSQNQSPSCPVAQSLKDSAFSDKC